MIEYAERRQVPCSGAHLYSYLTEGKGHRHAASSSEKPDIAVHPVTAAKSHLYKPAVTHNPTKLSTRELFSSHVA